ncbi:MAG: hypothetical protein NC252_09470 [Roseburia sp.]|nr:hypothetical protein [Roseburia sp.]MCM1421194.1 hypothetical protein [Bacteroides sp.]
MSCLARNRWNVQGFKAAEQYEHWLNLKSGMTTMDACYSKQWYRVCLIIVLMVSCRYCAVAQRSASDKLARQVQGKWVLKEIGEEDADNFRPSPFHQYRYHGKNCFMMISFVGYDKNKPVETGKEAVRFSCKWGGLSFTSQPSTVVEGENVIRMEKKGRKRFHLKWTNWLPNYKLYPQGTVVEEIWKKSSYPEAGNLIVRAIAMKGKVKNRFIGLWRRDIIYTYTMLGNSDIGTMQPCEDGNTYKIYGDKVSLLVSKIDFDPLLTDCHIRGEMRPQKYVSSTALEENGNQCLIEWENENSFQLTYFDDRHLPYIEVWRRVVMPNHILNIFRNAE